MNATTASDLALHAEKTRSSRGLLLAVGLMSFAALLLELSLTRLFSVVLFYHFAFLAISIALLGLGAGAVFAYLWRAWLQQWTVEELGSALCLGNALIIVGVLEVVLHSAVSVHLDWGNFQRLTVLYLASAVPFFISGLLFSIVFARYPKRITQLYGADLAGGSLACLALVPLLNVVGAPNTVLFSGFAVALAGAAWAGRRRWTMPLALAAALVVLIAANFHGDLFDLVYVKGRLHEHPLYAKWNAISRVDVFEADLFQTGFTKWIVIDADAGTGIMEWNPLSKDPQLGQRLRFTLPSLPSVLRPHGDFAIIGPGGGPDVFYAVQAGSPSVTGIEINPIIANNIMRGVFAADSHYLYELPQVHIHVSDGRSFIRSSRDRYDVLQMTLVDTWASTAAGAFALSENNLYTVEAFREYFEHLKPDGMIAITRWEFAKPREALRVVSQAMEALRQLGVRDTTRNFIVVSDGPLDVDGRPVIVLAKKTPFTEEEQRQGLQDINGTSTEPAKPNLRVLYMPMLAGDSSKTHPVFGQLIRSQDPYAFAAGYAYNVSPVTDNAPFFFFTLKLDQLFGHLNRQGVDWKVNLGVLILGLVLIISVGAVIGFLVLPLALSPQARSGSSVRLLYFIAIGLGYILVEIAFIQRFMLFLGHPTYALTVVVFLMLLSSGLGSLLSRRWFDEPTRVASALVGIVVVLLIYVFALPHVLEALVGLAFALKLLISGLLLIPLGLAMGMPFPSGLRALSCADEEQGISPAPHGTVEWAWAMNAASSVLASVLAMVIALQFGLNVTLFCGAGAYLLAILLLPTFGTPQISMVRRRGGV
ncbi:MAG: hypothetical protein WCC92_03635 [Candidatus Korobacteraceae bacterium]